VNAAERRVVVTGAGVICALGDAPSAVYRRLCAGEGAIAPVEAFAVDGLRCREAAAVAGFEPRRYLGQGNLRPLDRTAQLVAAAAQLALDASGWTRERRHEHELGLALGTMFGSVHTISAFDRRALTAGPIYAKPMDFANTVINAAAGQTAIWHGLTGVNSTLSGGTTSGLLALAYAADLIRSGRASALLAGGGDELCFESFYGFYRTGRMAGSRNGAAPCAVPFDARRNGFVLGEGAALLMLEEERAARRRGAPILAEIRGHGSGYDPSRGRDGESGRDALVRAVDAALADAGLAPHAIDAVSASANGSVAGDRCEAAGLAAVFGRPLPPVAAVKSMLGECLGASGALQTLTLIEALDGGVLPGIRGLEHADAALASNGTPDGTPDATPGDLARSRPLAIDAGLVSAVGLDGNVGALVVSRAGEGDG